MYESYETVLCHHGILGQKWGIRRYQNKDGSVTAAGAKRYHVDEGHKLTKEEKAYDKGYRYGRQHINQAAAIGASLAFGSSIAKSAAIGRSKTSTILHALGSSAIGSVGGVVGKAFVDMKLKDPAYFRGNHDRTNKLEYGTNRKEMVKRIDPDTGQVTKRKEMH